MTDFTTGELVYVWRTPYWRLVIVVGPVADTYTRWMVLVDGECLNYSRMSMHKPENFKVERIPKWSLGLFESEYR